MRVDGEKRQKHVYYVSKALIRAEIKNTHIKKATFSSRLTTKKLYHYFQAQLIVILTTLPLRAMLHKLIQDNDQISTGIK